MYELKRFTLNQNNVPFPNQPGEYPTIRVIGYNAAGEPVYGCDGSDGNVHALGLLGEFTPLDIPDFATSWYNGARVPVGLRNLSGHFNNLTQDGQSWEGIAQQFIRLTLADHEHYVQQNTANSALANESGMPEQGVPTGVIPESDLSSLYADPTALLIGYMPRMISQTIVCGGVTLKTVDGHIVHDVSTAIAMVDDAGLLDDLGEADSATGDAQFLIRNQSTVVGDPSPTGWFTLFGQHFKHGLDFINKPDLNATITIALAPDDPLYGSIGPDGQPVYSIKVHRASVNEIDGQGQAQYVNLDSPDIDQNQTYGPTDAVTQLLRKWVVDPHTGKFIAGAELLDGYTLSDAAAWTLNGVLAHQTLPTLNELRAHVDATGRADLTWDDLANFRVRDAHGQILDANPDTVEVEAVYTREAILLDMNPHFDDAHIDQSVLMALDSNITGISFDANNPFGMLVTYADNSVKNLFSFVKFADFSISAAPGTADYAVANELLLQSVGDHYIAGDGRVNENFGLTAIHHVFHEDHNVQLSNLQNEVLAQTDVNVRHNWQVQVSDGAGGFYSDAAGNFTLADGATVSWDQDKLFTATKLSVEMEYQHVAIDQYARLITPDLPDFVRYDSGINANITLESGQATFRFSHSQVRETIDTLEKDASGSYDLTGAITHYALEQASLNPAGFADIGPTAIALGMTRQVSDEIDQFVTPALQQGLLGQPLDLATINLARGRDVGLPTLNQARQQIQDALIAERAQPGGSTHHTNLIVDALTPYTSWSDFANNMVRPESLVNFIAAYAFDGDAAHAQVLLDADWTGEDQSYVNSAGDTVWVSGEEAACFLSAAAKPDGTHVQGDDGFNHIDLWIGGLAERHVFLGQLGSTFNAIFEDQMERLMDGDRFYYLYRLDLGLPARTSLKDQLVTKQFKDIIERTTAARHLVGEGFGYIDSNIELGGKASGSTPAYCKSEHKYGDQVAALGLGACSTASNSIYTVNSTNVSVTTRADLNTGETNKFIGGAGGDLPDGGTGNVSIPGGDGNATYVVDTCADTANDLPNLGQFTLQGTTKV